MARESQYINGWIKKGEDIARLQTKRADLLKVINALENPVPEPIRLTIEGTTDLERLDAWFEAALDDLFGAKIIAQLRKAMQLE